ncbi:MAG: beta-propeller fold lactonase family protein [Moraxellaceae bacterium]|nr:beta-propeller fold lactonase family protein [Moraxellaceae bacterium]
MIGALGACATTPRPSATYVYVANADSREVRVSRLDPAGGLTPLQQLPVEGSAMPMAVSPDKRFLFVSLRTAPFRVASLAIDPATGQLRPVGNYPLPDNMANISTDRTGRLLFAASYGGNKLSVSRIAADGSVAAAHQVIETKPMAHSVQASPDNRTVLATSLGGDEVMLFSLDASAGVLTPRTPSSIALPPKSGPRHVVFGPDGRFAYLLNELDSGIHVLALDRQTSEWRLVQSDSALPPGFTGKPWGADIHVTPDGKFLYASERGSDTLAAFRIDAQSGRIARIANYPTETQPRGFNIDPGGRYVLVAGQKTDSITVYEIDPAQGSLRSIGRHASGKNPNWIEIVAFP